MDQRTPTPEELLLLTEEEPLRHCAVPDCPRILRREGCHLCSVHETEVKRKLKRRARSEKAKEKAEMNKVLFALELQNMEAKHQHKVGKLRRIAMRHLEALPAPSLFGMCLPAPMDRFSIMPPPPPISQEPPPISLEPPPVRSEDAEMDDLMNY